MVNFLELLYVLTACFTVAAIVLLIRGCRRAALWCAWVAFVGALSAAMLHVRLTPKAIATVAGEPVLLIRRIDV